VELKPDRRRWGGALDRGHYFGALSSTSAIDRGFFGQAATSHGRGNTVVGSCTAARHVMTKYPWFPLSGWIYQQWCVRFEYGKHVRSLISAPGTAPRPSQELARLTHARQRRCDRSPSEFQQIGKFRIAGQQRLAHHQHRVDLFRL